LEAEIRRFVYVISHDNAGNLIKDDKAKYTYDAFSRYIRSYDLIASEAESARTYYHYASDEMSNITHVAEGTDVLNHYEYDAWGNTTVCEEPVENRFRFNGQQYDPITRQYYLRARFYNPENRNLPKSFIVHKTGIV